MQTSHRERADGGGAGRGLLGWVIVAAAFVGTGYLAPAIHPPSAAAAEVAAAVGAVMLALPILRTAAADLRAGHVHLDGLVAIAVLAALARGDPKSAGVIALLMLLSTVIETRTAVGAHRAIEGLVRLTPTTARRRRPEGGEEEVPAHELRPGDRVLLRPGDLVPADGRIIAGRTAIQEATITGEPLPADKADGDEVFAGTQNLTGAVEIEVTRVGPDTTLGRVREMILQAERTRLPFAMLIDRYVGHYTPLVLALAAVTWFFTDDWDRVVAMLVFACPCALVLATPTAMVAALAAAARSGILVRNVVHLEAVGRTDAVVFDKTGTLTAGEPEVVRLAPAEGVAPSELLAAAAAAERGSQHPVAVAIARLAREAGVAVREPEECMEEAGRGVRARVEGRSIMCGRAEWLCDAGVVAAADGEQAAAGHLSVVHVAVDGRYLGWIGLEDRLRPGAREAVRRLRELNIQRIAMVTGDRERAARKVAEAIECSEYRAGCLPAAKVEFVSRLRAEGRRVAVVGDGVNDAPALAAGDTGIAMGAAGSDVALHTADIALMADDLRRVPRLIELSRYATRVVAQNIGVGVVFIVGGMALAAAGGVPPIAAALLHNVGSLMVVFNSGRLMRFGEQEVAAAPPARAH
ncbi:MAG: cation-translocating P-type ATPase [Kiritimatiellae bacterium]|nr:cation-translocating P-type ATPase [Kiritimatiellia bacterium]